MADFENIAKQFCEAYYNLFSTNRDVSDLKEYKSYLYLIYRTLCNYLQRTPCFLLKENSSLASSLFIINLQALTRLLTRSAPLIPNHLWTKVSLLLSPVLYRSMTVKTWCLQKYSIYKKEDSKAIISSTTSSD